MNWFKNIARIKYPLVVVFTTLVLAPITEAKADSYNIDSRADLINFISTARADTPAAHQFLERLGQWGVQVEHGQKKYLGSILTSNQVSTGLSFRDASVSGSILLTHGGIEQINVSLTSMTIRSGPNLNGICSVLSVLYSLHEKLELISTLEDPNGSDMSYDLLVEAKNATGKPNTYGAGPKEMKNIYEHFANKAGKEIVCTDENDLQGGTEEERKAKCEKLQELLEDEDCDLLMDWPQDDAGHGATIKSASFKDGKCIVEVKDTGSQGVGNGVGVPADPGTLRVTVAPFISPRGNVNSGFSTVTTLGYVDGSDDDKPFMPDDFRNYYSRLSKKMTDVSYFCCRAQDSL